MLPPYLRRADMDQFVGAFKRATRGSWTCVEDAALHTDAGPIRFTAGATFTPGHLFMGVDVANVLNDYCAKGLAPLGWRGECPPTRRNE